MTRVCTVSHDINIMMFRINTAETLSAARRSRASTSADLDHAASQHIKEPNDRCMLIVNRGVPGLVDRVHAVHAGSRRLDSHRRQMSERFFRSKRPRYPHPVCSELGNSGIGVAVGDCSVTEHRRGRPPYQPTKLYDEDGRTAPGVCDYGFVLLSHSGNVVTRIGLHTNTLCMLIYKFRLGQLQQNKDL